jgi:hypothetical protein
MTQARMENRAKMQPSMILLKNFGSSTAGKCLSVQDATGWAWGREEKVVNIIIGVAPLAARRGLAVLARTSLRCDCTQGRGSHAASPA